MGFHHVAIATTDLAATHRFYTEAMGFTLAKVENGPTEQPPGWAKHVFYETGGHGMFAVWELHDDRVGEFDPAISTGLGLPIWVNHVAFDAPDHDRLEAARDHWLATGHDVMEIDHGWCRSVYTTDPNGVLVEWCTTTRAFTDEDRAEAERALVDPEPGDRPGPEPIFHRAAQAVVH